MTMTCTERVHKQVHSKLLPGVTARETQAFGKELRRDVVYLGDEWMGEVAYVENDDGYGWRPVLDRSAPLTCRVLAIRNLPLLAKEAS